MSYNEPYRVFRGSSWDGGASDARVAFRLSYDPGFRFDFLGLRLVRVKTLLHQLSEISSHE